MPPFYSSARPITDPPFDRGIVNSPESCITDMSNWQSGLEAPIHLGKISLAKLKIDPKPRFLKYQREHPGLCCCSAFVSTFSLIPLKPKPEGAKL
jgi:hypothetical protein